MEVLLVQGTVKSSVKSDKKRSPATSDEGFFNEFGLMLQSLMPGQIVSQSGTGEVQENQISSMERPQSVDEITAMALEIPVCPTGCQVLPEWRGPGGTLQMSLLGGGNPTYLFEQTYSVQEGNGDAGAQLQSDLSGLLDVAEAQVDVTFHSEEGFYLNSEGADITSMEFRTLEVPVYDQRLNTMEAMAQLNTRMALQNGSTAENAFVDSMEDPGLQYQGSAEDFKSDVDGTDGLFLAVRKEHIHQDQVLEAPASDYEQGKFQRDQNNTPHAHIHEQFNVLELYAKNDAQPMSGDEMGAVNQSGALDFHRTLAEIADRVRVLLSGRRSEMEVLLKPPELGKMVIKVAVEEGALEVRITVNSNAVKEFLQSHTQELKAILDQKGYSFTNIDVNIGQGYQQPQRDGFGSGWQPERPMSRSVRPDMAELQRSTISPAAYYDGHHRLDCLA